MIDAIRELKVDERENVDAIRGLRIDELESVSGGCPCGGGCSDCGAAPISFWNYLMRHYGF
jgi:hypothetical protein